MPNSNEVNAMILEQYKNSLESFNQVKRSVDKQLYSPEGKTEFSNQIKAIADTLRSAKAKLIQLKKFLPTVDIEKANDAKTDLDETVIKLIENAFEQLDDWEDRWIALFKDVITYDPWYGPFTKAQVDEMVSMRMKGIALCDIAQHLNLNIEMNDLSTMITRWMIHSKK